MTLYDWIVAPFVEFDFMRRALVACLALGLGSGPVGVLLLRRRMSLVGDAMSHAVLPGAAVGFLFAGLSLPAMGLGGLMAGLTVALLSGLVTRTTVLREDASFASFYLSSLAAGVLIVSLRGSNIDLLHVLFGTILAIDAHALYLVGGIASFTLLVLALALVYRPLVAECFDPGFLRAVGGNGPLYHALFLFLVVINLVAGFQALGTLMAVGLMMLPAAVARLWVGTLPALATVAAGIAALRTDWPDRVLPSRRRVRTGYRADRERILCRLPPVRANRCGPPPVSLAAIRGFPAAGASCDQSHRLSPCADAVQTRCRRFLPQVPCRCCRASIVMDLCGRRYRVGRWGRTNSSAGGHGGGHVQGIGVPGCGTSGAASLSASEQRAVYWPVPACALHRRGAVTGPPAIRTREIGWSWQGKPITLGIDEAGDGPPVLLLPALSSISTRREMHPLMQRLAPTFRVIAPDWPGFGDWSRPAIAWTPDALSAFLDHLMQQDLPPLHATIAAGHAASYALHLAAQHPGSLGRLALLAPTWRGPLPTMAGGERPVFGTIRRAIGLPVLGPLLYRANVNRFVVRMMVAGHVYSDANALSGDRLRKKRAVMSAQGARFGSAAFVTGGLDRVAGRAEWLDLARSVTDPLLIAYGAETPPKSRAEMEALTALPGVQSVVTPRGKLGFHEEFADDLILRLIVFMS